MHTGGHPDHPITVDVQHHYPAVIDDVADGSPSCRNFLRSAWYAGDVADGAATLVARMRDGTPFAALPTRMMRPFLPGVRAVAGSYWPFRTLVVKANTCPKAIRAMVAHPHFRRMFSPMWRLGPVYADDPSAALVLQGMRDDGWHVLARNMGATWRLSLAGLHGEGKWPRKSTLKRLRGYERQLIARHGAIRYEVINGADWNDNVCGVLADIERRSWVGKQENGGDTKFLNRKARCYWTKAVRDTAIAKALSATILFAGERAIAFSFDLRSGDGQYSIASSYDEDYAPFRPGKIVTYHQFQHALAQGVQWIDLGAGDSGYKKEIGAEKGAEIHDYMLVRYGWLAGVIARFWQRGEV
ncbi:MAG: GNAT family N-acetyltransferase [Sphingobium sp.]|nr:GNAT family N-acetyltransferase [Sphingobium sp.]